jgi:hypothetical protein
MEDTNIIEHPLDEALGSTGRVRLLRFLLSVSRPVSTPQAADGSGLTLAGARGALEKLVDMGLLARTGSRRSRQYALREEEPLTDALRRLFQGEQQRYESFLRELRQALKDIVELHGAWIVDLPAEPGEPVEIALAADAAGIKNEIRSRLIDIEKRFDVVIELVMHDPTHQPPPKPDASILLAGFLPPVSNESRGTLGHDAHDRRSARMSEGIARLIEENPSLVERAADFIQRRLQEGAGTASQDLLEWSQILRTYSSRRLQEFLTSDSSRAQRLRQSSPFFAVLNAEERDRLVDHLDGAP